MGELDEIVSEFLIESHENLDALDRDLLVLEEGAATPEMLAGIFRTIHSIKGACGFLGFATLESVTHAGESLLSKLRDGVITVNPEVTTALLVLTDAVREMLAAIEATGADGGGDHGELLATLRRLNGEEAAPAATAGAPAAQATAAGDTAPEPVEAEGVSTPVGFFILSNGAGEAGGAAGEPTGPARSAESSATDHVNGANVNGANVNGANGDGTPTGTLLVAPPPGPPAAPTSPATGTEPGTPMAADAGDAHGTAGPTPPAENRPRVTDTTIRVDVGVLDNLMTLVGELVLARNELVQLISEQQDNLLTATAQRLSLITTELQEGAMKTRMQPIGTVTGKLPRVVRDLAVQFGKQVRLEVEGEDTELDKSIIEAISDPLIHLVRNAVDHGIEDPETRRAASKLAIARVGLRAYHEGGKVNIEITDDGAGIDPAVLGAKALEKGLVSRDQLAGMGEREICELIFLPGFSTAASVTNVSGRGVGMDVVRSNIERIGGTVEVQSALGHGTTFKIKIPLTLAIIPALFVASAGERFAIPQANVLELVRIGAGDAHHRIELIHGAPVYRLRGKLLPLVYLRRELGQPEPDATAAERAVNIVVLQTDDREFGMVVEGVSDSAEIVVKPLGHHLKAIPAYAGATIMGDGQVALILDVMGLAEGAELLHETTRRAAAEASAEADAEAARLADRESLLLLSTMEGGRMAIPLTAVDRLEKFPMSSVEGIGDQDVVQYRGVILPLVYVSQVLPDRGLGGYDGEGADTTSIHVVVHERNGGRVGIVVERILDIVDEVVQLDQPARVGVLGSIVIDGRVTEVLDVAGLLEAAGISDQQFAELGV